MLRAGSVASIVSTERVALQLGEAIKRTLIASDPASRPAPNAYLVEQAPLSRVDPHFHLNCQFQVIVAGEGELGRHRVAPVTVHFAGRQTGYGPLTAGPAGLTYFTLRPAMEPTGPHFIATSRHKIDPAIAKRHATSEAFAASSIEALRLSRTSESTLLLAPDDSGLGAWLTRLPPASSLAAPEHRNGGGRFYLVTGGTLLLGEESHGRLSCVFTSADEAALKLTSGADGLEVVTLQFPALPL